MDFTSHFAQKRTTENLALAVDYVGMSHDRFKSLITVAFDKDDKLSAIAAHAVSHCVDRIPGLLVPYIGAVVDHLDTKPNVGVKRNIVRLLQFQNIPEECQGKLTQHCFDYLQDSKEAVAVKAFSMTVLYNMCQIHPDLINELTMVIEDLMSNASGGIISRGKKTLNQLKKISPPSTNHE